MNVPFEDLLNMILEVRVKLFFLNNNNLFYLDKI